MREPRWGAGLILVCGGLLVQAARGQTADAAKLIQAQDAALGTGSGDIVLRQAARLGSSVTIGAGHNLRIEAPLTVGPASIHLSGHNQVSCSARVTVENAVDLFVAESATDIRVSGCTVGVAGRSGGYLLVATRAARVVETDNHLRDLAIFNTHNTGGPASQTTDITITGNSTEFSRTTGPIGVYLMYVLRGTVNNNSLEGTGHGVEWWGGDANQYWPGFDKVTEAGQLTIHGNHCKSAGGACVWGSDGVDITVSGNTADTCSDVCFDTEGGVRTRFTANTARACGNGCYAAEFESLDAVFDGNTAYADKSAPAKALVLIKHPSGRGPNHQKLEITGNTLQCGDLCTALYSEGEAGVTVANNTVTNGSFQFINYTNDVRVTGNTLRFTVPVGNTVAIAGPSLAGGHQSQINANQIVAQAGTGAGSVCIAQSWSDYNATDQMQIEKNACSGFAHGIATATGGGNPGAPHAVWLVQGNRFAGVPAGQELVHQHTSGNEVYSAK